jgi:Family of unknown function (DUF6941)
MRVQWATLARYAEAEAGSGLITIVGAGAKVFGASRLPARLTTFLALQLRYPEPEADHEHVATLTVRDPDLQPLGRSVDIPFEPALNPLHAPGWEALFSMAGPVSLTVDAVGTYSIGIELTGAHAAEIPFRVVAVA